MRAVIQRVTSAKVEVEGKVTGEIEKGFLILFGVGQEDTEADCDKLADKISKLRIFADENEFANTYKSGRHVTNANASINRSTI